MICEQNKKFYLQMNRDKHSFLMRFFHKYLCLPAFICGLFFFTSCDYFKITKQTNTNQTIEKEESFDVPKSNIDLEKPLEISNQPKDVALCKNIDNTIKESEFSKARWGIIAISLKNGRVVCGIEEQQLFNPASIEKLLTSIVALDKLGQDFRWKTSVYAKTEIEKGTIDGDLILYGQGSPDLDNERLNSLVRQLKEKSLKTIKGDIIGDESYFKGDNLGDGWTWNSAQWYYGAASSALSFNLNQAKITIENGKPRSDSKYVELTGEVEPIEDIEAIGLKREIGTNKVFVWGYGESLNVRIAVSKPALLSAKIFKETLETNGVKIEGDATTANWRTANKLETENASELASVQSQTISEIVRKMNKDSVNFYAEMILRTLGKKFGNEAPDEDPKMQKLRGDDLAGAAVIKKWLTDQNVATGEIAIHDGSGLSRLNFVTPESIARALVFASNSEFAETFKNGLPVSGQNGTLRGRLENVSGRILGKTGSITYVNSLAGYAKTSDDTLAFVIIGNNLTHDKYSSDTVDKIAGLFVKH